MLNLLSIMRVVLISQGYGNGAGVLNARGCTWPSHRLRFFVLALPTQWISRYLSIQLESRFCQISSGFGSLFEVWFLDDKWSSILNILVQIFSPKLYGVDY